jgi:isocitrate dehydrogenase
LINFISDTCKTYSFHACKAAAYLAARIPLEGDPKMTLHVNPADLTATELPARKPKVVVARGDGIGPEIMEASLSILNAAGADLDVQEIEIGEAVYLSGHSSGIAPESWEALRGADAFYKAPITTPQGGGYKSLNVTIRKSLGLYANVRPCLALAPYVATKHPKLDLVIIRENEEDLYAGIEHRQTDEVVQCLKVLSRPGCERIVRYAFEYARNAGRKRVTCFTKDNIMKLTDGMFRKAFDEIGAEYPDIARDHQIIDIATARLADTPEDFDVIVTLNLYGDIISDVAAQIAGSVGLAPSANIGRHGAMFEAIHGSAPDIAGKGVANPSGLLLAGVEMLAHVGQGAVAARVRNAWLKTIEDGIHTGDIFDPAVSREKVGTRAFADALIARLGQVPTGFPVAVAGTGSALVLEEPAVRPRQNKTMDGIDIFVDWDEAGRDPQALAARLQAVGHSDFTLEMITNRGVKVWPGGMAETTKTDHWRCRFKLAPGVSGNATAMATQCAAIAASGLDVIKIEGLYSFDGKPGYSMGQGQ